MELDEVTKRIAEVLGRDWEWDTPTADKVWDALQLWARETVSPEEAHILTSLLLQLVIAVRRETKHAQEKEQPRGQEASDPSLPPQSREAPEG